MKLVNSILPLVLALSLFSSCATIMHGTRQNIGISSNPSNAEIWVDRNYVGNTPLIVEMSRKENHLVQIQLAGFLPYEITITKQLSGWVFGNVIFGGVIGLAIDAVSGGIYQLTPDQVQAEMISNNFTYTKKSKDSYIGIVMKVDPSWKKIDNLVAAQ